MALSAPPPPPDPPSSSSTATTITTSTRPIFTNTARPPTPQPHPFSLQQSSHYPLNQQPQRLAPSNLLYPVASSGRGFLPKPTNIYPSNRPVVSYPGTTRPPFGLNYMDSGSGAGVKPTHLHHALFGASPNPNSAVLKGFPVVTSSSHPKIASAQPSILDCNGFKDRRDRSKDDTFAVIRDRKVRISDNASLYALCRSWLRNGLPEETQTQYMDGVRSLPRPLPLAPQDAESLVQKEEEKEEEEEVGGSVEHLSTKGLLQRHVKRAKRIRSRLREERLRRIAKYKTRLALLLPPMVEQQHRNDPTSGN